MADVRRSSCKDASLRPDDCKKEIISQAERLQSFGLARRLLVSDLVVCQSDMVNIDMAGNLKLDSGAAAILET